MKWKDSLTFDLGDQKELAVPDTAVLLPCILNILKGFKLSEDFSSEEAFQKTVLSYHRIIESFKHAFSIRAQLADPDFLDVKNVSSKLFNLQNVIY